MEFVIGLLIFGVVVMIALYIGQLVISLFFGLVVLIFVAIGGAFKAIINLFKGDN